MQSSQEASQDPDLGFGRFSLKAVPQSGAPRKLCPVVENFLHDVMTNAKGPHGRQITKASKQTKGASSVQAAIPSNYPAQTGLYAA